jgi:hypothetical protein
MESENRRAMTGEDMGMRQVDPAQVPEVTGAYQPVIVNVGVLMFGGNEPYAEGVQAPPYRGVPSRGVPYVPY